LTVRSLANHAMLTSGRPASTERTDGVGPAAARAASSNARRKRRFTYESMTRLGDALTKRFGD